MSNTEALLTLLGIKHPLIQAPMAGVSTPAMAAAVSNAGGLGSLGLGASSVEQAREQIRKVRALTDLPFNCNFFCHRPAMADPLREAVWLAHLAGEFAQFEARPPAALREIYTSFIADEAMFAMLLEEKPKVVSFHFGLPQASWIEMLHGAGIVTMACATTPAEAAQIEAAGIKVLIAQGAEAGGHRGIFEPEKGDAMIGTFALVRMLARQSKLPVVASGGIMDGAGMAAAFALGAAGAQLGTAFILAPESSASAAYRGQLKSERAQRTGITAAISGRPARGMVNRMHELAQGPELPDYPIAYDAGKALNAAALPYGNAEYAAHWAGQGAPLVRECASAELVRVLIAEWRDASAVR